MAERAITIRGTSYPVILPKLSDPRLHVAAVTLTVHLLGQVGLHFRLSVPQILAAILTAAIIEVAISFRQQKAFIWPASAMLTASGVALILRVPGMPANEPWNLSYLPLYAGVSAFALLTKYVIKYRGTHVFNPSNLGLVVAFIVLGNSRVEPLDLWWAPITNPWMVLAYIVIIVGSSALLIRAGLFAMSVAFFVTLAAGMAVLAASGHCMTANWAFAPVCGADYWRVIVTSPEVLIYAAFMVTDPRVIPRGKVGRVVFATLVGVLCTLFMAPQTDEFGTKVGLLAGLVPLCAGRYLLERRLPEPQDRCRQPVGLRTRAAGRRHGLGAGPPGGRHRLDGRRGAPLGHRRRPRGDALTGRDRGQHQRGDARGRRDPARPVHAAADHGHARPSGTGTTRSRRTRSSCSSRWPRTSRSRTRRFSGRTSGS